MQLPKLNQFSRFYKTQLEQLRSQRIFQDRLSWAIMVPTFVLNGVTFLLLVLKLHPTEFAVPVHYSSLVGFDRLGPWYQSYSIGIFAVGVTILNSGLAVMAFSRSRITSFFLMVGAFVVALFALVISLAFTAIA